MRFLGSQDVRRADLEDEGGEDGRSWVHRRRDLEVKGITTSFKSYGWSSMNYKTMFVIFGCFLLQGNKENSEY